MMDMEGKPTKFTGLDDSDKDLTMFTIKIPSKMEVAPPP